MVENSFARFRIATWNLERPKQGSSAKNQRCLNKVRELDADVWILTETNRTIKLQDYESVASALCNWNGYEGGENLSTVWSRWKLIRSVPTFDPKWAVCAEIDSPFGAMMIYGTVIPYANEKGISGTAKCWEEHRRSIQQHHEDWLRIQNQYPNHLMCIAGDFNQSRDQSGWYEDKQAIELLSTALQDLSLVCVTDENFQRTQGLSRSTVDHICLSKRLLPYKVVVDA